MSDVEVEGRGRDKAVLLLAAAEDLGLDASVVRTSTNGYLVPEEVAKAAFEEKKPAKKTTAAKKTAARKTAAKKTAAKKTAPKE
jgi:DNA topoisomerase-1